MSEFTSVLRRLANHSTYEVDAKHFRAAAAHIERLEEALRRIASDKDVSCLAGNPALWPSQIAKIALEAPSTGEQG